MDIGWAYYRDKKTDVAIEYFKKSLALSEIIGNREGIVESYMFLGWAYFLEGKDYFDKGLEMLEKGTKVYESPGEERGAVRDCYRGIGYIHWMKGDLKKASKFYEKALAICEKNGRL